MPEISRVTMRRPRIGPRKCQKNAAVVVGGRLICEGARGSKRRSKKAYMRAMGCGPRFRALARWLGSRCGGRRGPLQNRLLCSRCDTEQKRAGEGKRGLDR